ncbi:MAG: OmpA family protein [Desulfobacterales bacterium]|nr:OmpA family protein [Desulfobacterales bacterium]
MDQNPADKSGLPALKNLLIAPEKRQIQTLENRLDNPMIRAKEISQSLPEAISLSVMSNDKLSRTMQPVIDKALNVSVRNNPKAIADAIFPALGPGIRKAISATILGMIQSLNHLLNSSFSFQGLKWRFEAFRTGRPFAEIVLLHTLVFQVEQIFLIHKESGIVLDHVVDNNAVIQDPDLVSGMLTAIQDFVKDSFDTETEEDLETLRIGSNSSVWIEKGEHAFIAAVIKGRPPLDLRIRYRELIEEIHLKAGPALVDFDGDPYPFAIFRESLKDGLISRQKKEKKKVSPLLLLFFVCIFAVLGYFGYQSYQTHKTWLAYLDRLNAQTGLFILSTKKQSGEYHVKGLSDPLATDPQTLLTAADKTRITVQGHWTPFFSLDPQLVIKRANQILEPPPGISLSLSGTTLSAKGETTQTWINSFKMIAPTIAGVTAFDTSDLVSLDKRQLDMAMKQLEEFRLYFKTNSTRPVDGQEEVFSQLADSVTKIEKLQKKAQLPIQIVLLGHTDSSGTEKRNLTLSRQRAESVLNHLIIQGINPGFITISGVSTKLMLTDEDSIEDRKLNRAVSIKTFYQYSENGAGHTTSERNNTQSSRIKEQ